VADPGACSESPCRLQAPQCGCTEGLSCQGLAAPACLPASTGGPGEACGTTGCIGGLTCWIVTTDPQGSCQPYCTVDADCPESFCLGDPGLQAGVCLPGCDPVNQTGCPDGQSCLVSFGVSHETTAMRGSTTCGIVGSTPDGGTCSGPSCATGLLCLSGICHTVCRIGDSSICPPGQSCQRLVPPSLARGEEYGVCA
jgi:hypothetical protein